MKLRHIACYIGIFISGVWMVQRFLLAVDFMLNPFYLMYLRASPVWVKVLDPMFTMLEALLAPLILLLLSWIVKER